MDKKEITIKDVIDFLQAKVDEVYPARTSQYPKLLDSHEELITVKELTQKLINFWFFYKSHILTVKTKYIDGELKKEEIEEYWYILKEETRKKTMLKPPSLIGID